MNGEMAEGSQKNMYSERVWKEKQRTNVTGEQEEKK